MTDFLKFEEFINENFNIPLIKYDTDFLEGIIEKAYRDKIIKKRTSYNKYGNDVMPAWANYYPSISTSYNGMNIRKATIIMCNDKIFTICTLFEDGYYGSRIDRADSIKILVVSDSPIVLNSISQIFQNKITGSLGNTVFTFERIVHEDDVRHFVFEYKIKREDVEIIKLEDIMDTQEYKDIIDTFPVEMCSTSTQLKHSTIVFAIKSSHIFDTEFKDILSKPGEKYLCMGYGLYNRGYIRSIPIYDYRNNRASVGGSFDSNNIYGWKQGLLKIYKLFKQKFEKFKKSPDIILDMKNPLTMLKLPEDIQEKLLDSAKNKKLSWERIRPYISDEKWEQNKTEAGLSTMGF